MRPNVVLVVFDTARADALEPFGAPPGSTPVVAEAMSDGVARTVTATSNWTLPSHASLFTGRLPRQLGLGTTGAPPRDVLAEHADRLLAARMAAAGWAAGAVSANPWITTRHGFAPGFDQFVEIHQRRHAPGSGWKERARWTAEAVMANLDDGLANVDVVMDHWLDTRVDGEPFFWFVNLMECHSPYLPPRPYNDLGLLDRFRAGRDARRYQSHRGFLDTCLGRLVPPAAALARMRHLYARSVLSMDDWLGRLFQRLARHGLADDTLVVVTSDHGENLGDAGLLGHTLSLDDRLIRVPLLARGPGAEAFSSCTSLADVPRALASGVGLAPQQWDEPACPDGVTAAQVDGLSSVDSTMAEALARSWKLEPDAVMRLQQPQTCVTDGRFKLVREGGAARLHDLHSDALETVDVADQHPDRVAFLMARLEEVDATDRVATLAGAGRQASDPELEDRLRLLGYL